MLCLMTVKTQKVNRVMVMMNCSTLSRGHNNLAVDPSVNYNAVDPSFTDDPLSHQIKDEKLLSSRTTTVHLNINQDARRGINMSICMMCVIVVIVS